MRTLLTLRMTTVSRLLIFALVAPFGMTANAVTPTPPAKGKPGAKAPLAHKPPAKPVGKFAAKPVSKLPVKPVARVAPRPMVRPAPEGFAWVQEARSWSRTVKAMDTPGGPVPMPAFSESLAVAFEGSFLVVPWSFVSDAQAAREGTRFYVDGTGAPMEARLVDVDLGANIALLKTDQPLGPTLNRERLRLDYPTPDESFLVLASRDWMRQGARFLKAKADGTTVRYQIALGNSDFSTSRFVFDRGGKLVAVAGNNPEDEGWSGTARSVVELLRRQDSPRPASISTSEQTRRQLYYWQDRWTQTLNPSKDAITFAGFDCQAASPTVSDQAVATQIRATRSMTCQNRMSLPLGSGYAAGMKVWTGEVDLKKTPDSSSGLPGEIEKALSADAFNDLDHKSALINLVSVPHCDQLMVTGAGGERSRVHFCTSGLKSESGLGDTAVSVITMPDGSESGAKLKYAVARLKGFDEAHSRRILEALVANVRNLP